MIKPVEMQLERPMQLADGVISTTTEVWEILSASFNGDLTTVKALTALCPQLAFAQYNYTPPIHFAVREGHVEMVRFLLDCGALDQTYRTYPFLDSLLDFAVDRGHSEITEMLRAYLADVSRNKFTGDNGQIDYQRTAIETEFEKAVHDSRTAKVAELLERDPTLALNETFHWGEGILLFPSKHGDWELCELLMRYGATVPKVSKWARSYSFERTDSAKFLLERGMDPNHQSWHHVTLLHDMAQAGDIDKAKLLIDHGADLDRIDDEYESTPLGMASRWGQEEMVRFLLDQGADPKTSGAVWSRPLAWAQAKGHIGVARLLGE